MFSRNLPLTLADSEPIQSRPLITEFRRRRGRADDRMFWVVVAVLAVVVGASAWLILPAPASVPKDVPTSSAVVIPQPARPPLHASGLTSTRATGASVAAAGPRMT